MRRVFDDPIGAGKLRSDLFERHRSAASSSSRGAAIPMDERDRLAKEEAIWVIGS